MKKKNNNKCQRKLCDFEFHRARSVFSEFRARLPDTGLPLYAASGHQAIKAEITVGRRFISGRRIKTKSRAPLVVLIIFRLYINRRVAF